MRQLADRLSQQVEAGDPWEDEDVLTLISLIKGRAERRDEGMAICVEAACPTDGDLEEEIMLKIEEFNQERQEKKDCLPLTDYEKLLLAQFLRSLIQ